MFRKTNWFKNLYLCCWCVLMTALLMALFPITPSPAPFATRMGILIKSLFMLALICALLFLLIWYFTIFKPTTKAPLILINLLVWIIGYPLLVLSYYFIIAMIANSATLSGYILLGILATLVLSLVALLLFSDPHSHHRHALEQEKTKTLWCTALFSLAALGATFWLPGMWGLQLPVVQLPGDLLGYYGAQLSLTFITISVMSVLSDKSVVVYWENIAEAKLIKPLFGSFASYTAYSITATVGAGISALMNNHLAFLVFFALNIPVLILLTLTMVDVYYGREGKKKYLEKNLQDNATAWQYTQKLQTLPADWEITVSLSNHATELKNHMLQLEHHLHQAIESHDLPYINELLSLYGRYMHCFVSPEGQSVAALLRKTTPNPWSSILMATDSHTTHLENTRQSFDKPFRSKLWRSDEALWAALKTAPELPAALETALRSEELPSVLAWVALHRMTLLFNDMITAHYPNSYLRRHYIDTKLQDGSVVFSCDPQVLATAFSAFKSDIMEKDGLLASLLRILLMAATTKDAKTLQMLQSCPFLPLLADSFCFLGATEEEEKLLLSPCGKDERVETTVF